MKNFLFSMTWVPFILIAMLSNSSGAAEIKKFDFKKFLIETDYKDCPESVKEVCAGRVDEYCPAGLSLHVSFAALTGDGSEQAIVQGSSCNTGTAGPDVHRVYRLNLKGEPESLTLSEPENQKTLRDFLFGNPNYSLKSENNLLIADWTDTSGRYHPYTVYYKWTGKKFEIASTEIPPTYKTSYTCTKADEEHEKAICRVKSLSALDVKLAEVYKKSLGALTGERQKALMKEQRSWIVKRNQDCPIYKQWVECLENAYTSRIEALSKNTSR